MSGFPTLFYKGSAALCESQHSDDRRAVLDRVAILFVFGHVMEGRCAFTRTYPHGVPGSRPGDDVAAAERFRHSSSSLIQSRSRYIIFVLLPPLSYTEFFAAYVLAAVVRGWWARGDAS